VVILSDFTFEGPQRRLPHDRPTAIGTPRVCFDAVRWVTPTPSPTPTATTTSRLLSRVRDDVMFPTGAKGQAYTALVYRHVDEVTTILARDATLRAQARALLLDLRPLLEDLVTHRQQSQARLTPHQAVRL